MICLIKLLAALKHFINFFENDIEIFITLKKTENAMHNSQSI